MALHCFSKHLKGSGLIELRIERERARERKRKEGGGGGESERESCRERICCLMVECMADSHAHEQRGLVKN